MLQVSINANLFANNSAQECNTLQESYLGRRFEISKGSAVYDTNLIGI